MNDRINIGICFYPRSNMNRLKMLVNSLLYRPITKLYGPRYYNENYICNIYDKLHTCYESLYKKSSKNKTDIQHIYDRWIEIMKLFQSKITKKVIYHVSMNYAYNEAEKSSEQIDEFKNLTLKLSDFLFKSFKFQTNNNIEDTIKYIELIYLYNNHRLIFYYREWLYLKFTNNYIADNFNINRINEIINIYNSIQEQQGKYYNYLMDTTLSDNDKLVVFRSLYNTISEFQDLMTEVYNAAYKFIEPDINDYLYKSDPNEINKGGSKNFPNLLWKYGVVKNDKRNNTTLKTLFENIYDRFNCKDYLLYLTPKDKMIAEIKERLQQFYNEHNLLSSIKDIYAKFEEYIIQYYNENYDKYIDMVLHKWIEEAYNKYRKDIQLRKEIAFSIPETNPVGSILSPNRIINLEDKFCYIIHKTNKYNFNSDRLFENVQRSDIVIDSIGICYRKNIIEMQLCDIKSLNLHFIEDNVSETVNNKQLHNYIKSLKNEYEKYGLRIYSYGSSYHTNLMTSRTIFYKQTEYEYAMMFDDDDFIINGYDEVYNLVSEVNSLSLDIHWQYLGVRFSREYNGMWSFLMLKNNHSFATSINHTAGEDGIVMLKNKDTIYSLIEDDKPSIMLYLWASGQGYTNKDNRLIIDMKNFNDLYCADNYNILTDADEETRELLKDNTNNINDYKYRYDSIVYIKPITGLYKNIKYTFMTNRYLLPMYNMRPSRIVLIRDKFYFIPDIIKYNNKLDDPILFQFICEAYSLHKKKIQISINKIFLPHEINKYASAINFLKIYEDDFKKIHDTKSFLLLVYKLLNVKWNENEICFDEEGHITNDEFLYAFLSWILYSDTRTDYDSYNAKFMCMLSQFLVYHNHQSIEDIITSHKPMNRKKLYELNITDRLNIEDELNVEDESYKIADCINSYLMSDNNKKYELNQIMEKVQDPKYAPNFNGYTYGPLYSTKYLLFGSSSKYLNLLYMLLIIFIIVIIIIIVIKYSKKINLTTSS